MIPSLPFVSIAFGAFEIIFRNFGALLRAWLIPVLLMIAIDALRGASEKNALTWFLFWLLETPVYALAAVACHRIVLLGPGSLTNPWSLHWSQRETSFFIWLAIFGVMMYVSNVLLSIVFVDMPMSAVGSRFKWLQGAFVLVALVYIYGRFAMVFPATALDARMIMSQSWLLTAGNGLRLTIALLLPLAPLYLVENLIAWGMPAGVMEYSGIVYIPVQFVAFAVVFAALSLSYKFLRDETGEI